MTLWAPLLRMILPWVLGAGALGGVVLWIDHKAYQRGKEDCEAKQAEAQVRSLSSEIEDAGEALNTLTAKLQSELTAERQARAAEAQRSEALLLELNVALAQIDRRLTDVSQDRPDCAYDPGAARLLNDAIRAANALGSD